MAEAHPESVVEDPSKGASENVSTAEELKVPEPEKNPEAQEVAEVAPETVPVPEEEKPEEPAKAAEQETIEVFVPEKKPEEEPTAAVEGSAETSEVQPSEKEPTAEAVPAPVEEAAEVPEATEEPVEEKAEPEAAAPAPEAKPEEEAVALQEEEITPVVADDAAPAVEEEAAPASAQEQEAPVTLASTPADLPSEPPVEEGTPKEEAPAEEKTPAEVPVVSVVEEEPVAVEETTPVEETLATPVEEKTLPKVAALAPPKEEPAEENPVLPVEKPITQTKGQSEIEAKPQEQEETSMEQPKGLEGTAPEVADEAPELTPEVIVTASDNLAGEQAENHELKIESHVNDEELSPEASAAPASEAPQEVKEAPPAEELSADDLTKDAVRKQFDRFDVDGDGFVDLEELLNVIDWMWEQKGQTVKLSQEQKFREAKRLLDADSEQMCFDEFQVWFCKMSEHFENLKVDAEPKLVIHM